MSDLHDDLYDRVREFRAAGFESDRIVVSADDWDETKASAEVNEGEGAMGGDETLINGVKVTWTGTINDPKVVFVEDDA